MEPVTGSHTLSAFNDVFGGSHCERLLEGGSLKGARHDGNKWSAQWSSWKNRTVQPFFGKKERIIPSNLGVFCAYAESLAASPIARSRFSLDLFLINQSSAHEMRLAYAFVLAGLCEIKKKNGQIYLQATAVVIDQNRIFRLDELVTCSVDRLAYEFILQSRPLPDGFIRNCVAPCYLDQLLITKSKTAVTINTNNSYTEKDKARVITHALAVTALDTDKKYIDPSQLIRFKCEIEKGAAELIEAGGSQYAQSVSTTPPLKRSKSYNKALQHSLSSSDRVSLDSGYSVSEVIDSGVLPVNASRLDQVDLWYCEQASNQKINSMASKATICMLSIKRWAERNKRSALVNLVDMALGTIISAALSGGVFGLVFILATTCNVIFWFLVDCSILFVKSIWHEKRLKKLHAELEVSDTRDVTDWSFNSDKDTSRAIRDLKTLLGSESFFCGYSGFTDLYNALKNIERENEKLLKLKERAGSDVSDELRYHIALSVMREREKQFETAGEHVEKYVLGVTQTFTAMKSEYDNAFETLWGAVEPMGDEALQALFLKSVDKLAGNDDPALKKAKYFFLGSSTLKGLVNKHLDGCKRDKKALLQELAAGIPLSDVLATEQEKHEMAEHAVVASDNPLSGKLWQLFRSYRDNGSSRCRQSGASKLAHRTKKNTKVTIKILKAYTVDYFSRIPYRMKELLISASISPQQRALLNPTGVAKEVFPNPVSGFGIGIVAWGVVKLTALLINRKNNLDNSKLAEKRRSFTNKHRFDDGFFDGDSSQSFELKESELKALRIMGKNGSAVLNDQLRAFIHLKPELDDLLEKVKSGKINDTLREKIAETFFAYQFLKVGIERNLTSSVGLSYQEMLRYRSLMHARSGSERDG